MKNALANTKQFVKKHKTPILVTTAVIATAVIVRRLDDAALSSMSDFIDSKDLTDEYLVSLVEEI